MHHFWLDAFGIMACFEVAFIHLHIYLHLWEHKLKVAFKSKKIWNGASENNAAKSSTFIAE